MKSNRNHNIHICPHCGTENGHSAEVWLKREPFICSHCNKSFSANQNLSFAEKKKPQDRHFSLILFVIIALLSGLAMYLNQIFDEISLREDFGQIIYYILLILVVSSAIVSGKIRQNLKYLAIWIGIFMILMTGYTYRHELSEIKEKVLAELIPARGFNKTEASISFPASSDGHFYLDAKVNGVQIMFLADTGASHIVLSPADAKKIGIQTDALRFDRFYETANGRVRGSSIQIADFKIGGIHLKEIRASVNEAKMRHSLLGMAFFRRLKSYEVKNDVLTLHWNK